MISHPEWFDRYAEPATGHIPIQIRVHGDAQARAKQNERVVKGALNQFLAEVRLSLAEHHSKTYYFADGVRLELRSIYGQVSGELYLQGGREIMPPFYGGILVQLQRVTDNGYWNDMLYGRDPIGPPWAIDPPSSIRELIPEMASKGSNEPGRPAVPGPLGDVDPTPDNPSPPPTDWLIIQVAGDKAVDANAITTGAVQIFRIHDPKHGAVVAYNRDLDEYLVSANWTVGASLTEFYVCGQKITAVPAISGAIYTDDVRSVRLYVYGLSVPSFETADKSKGIFIVAEGDNLWAVNANAGDVVWTLLAVASTSVRNQYGTQFTETVDPVSGVVTIKCEGSNALGVCSMFTVVITPREALSPLITGSITPVAEGRTVPIVSPSEAFVINFDAPADNYLSQQVYDSSPPTPIYYGWGDSYTPNGVQTASYYSDSGGPVSAPIDLFTGGYTPYTAPLVISISSHDEVHCERGPGFHIDVDPAHANITWVNYWRTRTASATISGGAVPGWAAMAMTYSNSWPSLGSPGGESGDPHYTWTQSNTIGPVVAFDYITQDWHDNKIAVRYQHSAGGSWIYDAAMHVNHVTMAPTSLCILEVLRNDETHIVTHDLLSEFGGTLAWSGTQTWDRDPFNLLIGDWVGGGALNFSGSNAVLNGFFAYGLGAPQLGDTTFATARWPGSSDGHYVTDPDPYGDFFGYNLAHSRVATQVTAFPTLGLYDVAFGGGSTLVNPPGAPASAPFSVGQPLDEFLGQWLVQFIWTPPRQQRVQDLVYRDLRSGGFVYQVLHGGLLDGSFVFRPLLDLTVGNDISSTPLIPLINEWAKLGGDDPGYTKLFVCPETIIKVSLL